jgi:hypothetical protein
MPMKKEDLILALGAHGYPLVIPEKEKDDENQFMRILSELAVSNDPRLIEGFPVLLARWAQKGLEFDVQEFLSRYERSQKRRNLEKLLLISSLLLDQEDLKKPKGFDKALKSLQAKWPSLRSAEVVTLDKGISLSRKRLLNALRRYTTDFKKFKSVQENKKNREHRMLQRHLHLSTLFSPKQKELILKKLKGKPLTKTEREYYSRVVKKKLDALVNSEVRKIATSLTKK